MHLAVQEIVHAIQQCLESGTVISSAKVVQENLAAESMGKTRPWLIHQVLRQNFDLTYRKITKLSPSQNSDRNRILRQRFAMCFLEVIKKKKRIILIDESALTYVNFQRRIWAPKHSSHGVRIRSVNPRVSLIMAIDNHGKVYSCMTSVNTDTTVMTLYIKELVKILDKESSSWRQNSCF